MTTVVVELVSLDEAAARTLVVLDVRWMMGDNMMSLMRRTHFKTGTTFTQEMHRNG